MYRENVQIGETHRVFGLDDDDWWEQQGESPSFIIQEITGLDEEIADAVVVALSEGEWVDIKDGGDAFYDATSNYEYTPDYQHEHHVTWRRFQDRVKFERRYLDRDLEAALEELFTEFPEEWTSRHDGPVRHFAPGSLSIYRARAASNQKDVTGILADPLANLQPPPRDLRVAGRLNAAGIGVFYGGLSADVCVAEMKPSLGSYVVVGKFDLVHSAKILDLTAFDRHPPAGSLFRPGFTDERLRWQFLQSFHWRITQPVQPGSEFLEYVPTQVVAEYLYSALGFDGVIFRSAQVGVVDTEDGDHAETPPELRNAALFGANGLVESGSRSDEVRRAPNDFELFPSDLDDYREDEETVRPEPLLRLSDKAPNVYHVTRIQYTSSREYIAVDKRPDGTIVVDGDDDF